MVPPQDARRDAPVVEPAVDFESEPLTRPEYISAVVHLYRGELHRATAWRVRLDNTTNWAVLTTAGLLTFSFREGGRTHWVLLLGMALISVFLTFEARRFRLADVWRARVRKIEENFYGPILRRELESPETQWGRLVAEDLFHPQYKISRLMALRLRFSRNYWPIYLVLILAWGVHILFYPQQSHSWADVRTHLGSGLLPWWISPALVGLFVVAVGLLYLLTPGVPKTEMEHWKSPTPGQEPILDV